MMIPSLSAGGLKQQLALNDQTEAQRRQLAEQEKLRKQQLYLQLAQMMMQPGGGAQQGSQFFGGLFK